MHTPLSNFPNDRVSDTAVTFTRKAWFTKQYALLACHIHRLLKFHTTVIRKCAALLGKVLSVIVFIDRKFNFYHVLWKTPKIFHKIVLNWKGHLSEPSQPCPLTRQVSFLTRWMISPLLSTTSRLPLSLEFSEESSSTMRSGTAPVTRITSTWRRPATWVKEPECRGVKRHPVDNTDLRWKACYSISGEQLHCYCWATSSNGKLSVLPEPAHSIACPVITLPYFEPNLPLYLASQSHLHSYPSSTG